MVNIKEKIKNEFWTGYSIFDKLFMVGMLLLQIVVYIVHPDKVLGIISGISCVISVVLCARGKISFYFVGFIQTISYLYLAWKNCFYGEVMENIFYLVTMVIGIFLWKKNMVENDDGSKEVAAKKFSVMQWIIILLATIVATVAMGFFLDNIGSKQAYTDAATNILAIFAQIMMIKGYREQWLWWLCIDVLCLKMWIVAGNWSMAAMYVAWIINCFYGWYNWSKLNKKTVLTKDKK